MVVGAIKKEPKTQKAIMVLGIGQELGAGVQTQAILLSEEGEIDKRVWTGKEKKTNNMKNKTLIEQSELVRTLLEAHPEHGGKASPAAMRTSFEDNPDMKPTEKQKEFMKTPLQKVVGGVKKVVGKVKKAVGLGDWTRYEGTPLFEQSEFVKTFLEGYKKRGPKKLTQSKNRKNIDRREPETQWEREPDRGNIYKKVTSYGKPEPHHPSVPKPKVLKKPSTYNRYSDSTQYEGPSLAETTKERIAKVAKRMIAKSKGDAEEEKKVPGTTEYGEGHAAGEHVSKETDIQRRAKKLTGRLKARQSKKNPTKPKKKEPSWMREPTKRTQSRSEYRSDSPKNDPWRAENSSTEYEGPSLAEQRPRRGDASRPETPAGQRHLRRMEDRKKPENVAARKKIADMVAAAKKGKGSLGEKCEFVKTFLEGKQTKKDTTSLSNPFTKPRDTKDPFNTKQTRKELGMPPRPEEASKK